MPQQDDFTVDFIRFLENRYLAPRSETRGDSKKTKEALREAVERDIQEAHRRFDRELMNGSYGERE